MDAGAVLVLGFIITLCGLGVATSIKGDDPASRILQAIGWIVFIVGLLSGGILLLVVLLIAAGFIAAIAGGIK